MTLTELIIALTIWAVVFLIVFSFVADSMEDMYDSSARTQTIDEGFIFKDKLNRYIIGWLSNMHVFTGSTNDVLYLKNNSATEWVIFWVVNKETMKLQPDYIHGNNFIWYINLSAYQIGEIDSNSGAIYDLNFYADKLFSSMRIRDFKTELYNNWAILDVYLSVINRRDEMNFWVSFDDMSVNPLDIQEFSLNF